MDAEEANARDGCQNRSWCRARDNYVPSNLFSIASQPAPVSVVIDEGVEFEKWWRRTPVLRKGKLQIAQEAWEASACLDKVKELNE